MRAMVIFRQDLDTSKGNFTREPCAHVPWERATCAWRFERIFHSLMLGYLNQKWWFFQQKIYPSALPKLKMEPKNDGFPKGISYSRVPFSGSMLNFGRVYKISYFWWCYCKCLVEVFHYPKISEDEAILTRAL